MTDIEILEASKQELVVREVSHPTVTISPTPEQIQALLLRSAHFIVQVLSQDTRFRQEEKAITDELGSVMEALGIHFDDCKCGCGGL